MTMTDPIVEDTTMVIPAIQSPNYEPGVSGWSINGDGSAEFSDAAVRGELLVDGPDGTHVRAYVDPIAGVVVELWPADSLTAGVVSEPARLRAGVGSDGAPGVYLEGPSYGGAAQSSVFLGKGGAAIAADVVQVGSGVTVSGGVLSAAGDVSAGGRITAGNAPARPVVTGTGQALQHWATATVTTNASGVATVTHSAGFTPAHVLVCQQASSGSFFVGVFPVTGSFTATTFQVKAYNGAAVYVGSLAVTYLLCA